MTSSYTGFGELASSTTAMGGTSRTFSYLYDADGNRIRITHPDGSWFGAASGTHYSYLVIFLDFGRELWNISRTSAWGFSMAKGSGHGRGAGPAGSRVRYDQSSRAKLVKTGGYQWSDEAEEAFFDRLAASCNVRASAASVGFTAFTVYRQRRMRADFALKWQAALEQGYARLEMALVEAANDTLAGVAFDAERPIPKMSVEQAMNVLRAHRHEVRGDGKAGPRHPPVPPALEAVRARIEKKVRAIKAARHVAPTCSAGVGTTDTWAVQAGAADRAGDEG